MNQKQKPKIKLFLDGLVQRFDENRDYFITVEFVFVSGNKNYSGMITFVDDEFIFNFSGSVGFGEISDAFDKLLEETMKYDSAEIIYNERGISTVIRVDERNVKLERRNNDMDISDVKNIENNQNQYFLNMHKAEKLLKVLGFTDNDGKLKNNMKRKYNQTDRFISLIGSMFDGMNNLTIVDCACGKSYLSFVLNHYLWEECRIKARFVGLDISENVIISSKKMAHELGYNNMEFIQCDLKDYKSDIKPNAVISLHACDTATDMALGYAIRNDVENIICVPCCHKELLDKFEFTQLDEILKHGILRARMNDILTDGIRTMKLESCGYKVSCVEYCSPLDTPKNLLIKAKKVSDVNKKVKIEYEKLVCDLKIFPAIEIYSNLTD